MPEATAEFAERRERLLSNVGFLSIVRQVSIDDARALFSTGMEAHEILRVYDAVGNDVNELMQKVDDPVFLASALLPSDPLGGQAEYIVAPSETPAVPEKDPDYFWPKDEGFDSGDIWEGAWHEGSNDAMDTLRYAEQQWAPHMQKLIKDGMSPEDAVTQPLPEARSADNRNMDKCKTFLQRYWLYGYLIS